jgi:hypothetical protein
VRWVVRVNWAWPRAPSFIPCTAGAIFRAPAIKIARGTRWLRKSELGGALAAARFDGADHPAPFD